MTTITTNYKGKEVSVSGNSEKDAKKALSKAKRQYDKEQRQVSIDKETACCRARESIGRISERIDSLIKRPNSTCYWFISHKQLGVRDEECNYRVQYKIPFSNQYGTATVTWKDCPDRSLQAVDGEVAVFDKCTSLWYAIGICNGIAAFVEIPGFIVKLIEKHFKEETY